MDPGLTTSAQSKKSKSAKMKPAQKYLQMPELKIPHQVINCGEHQLIIEKLKRMFLTYGSPEELKALDVINSFNHNFPVSDEVRFSKKKKLLRELIKKNHLSVECNQQFWNSFLFGTNRIIRCLESSTANLSLVFVDQEWTCNRVVAYLKSLCCLKDVVFLSVQNLLDLVNTPLRSIRRLMAFAIINSSKNNEVRDLISSIIPITEMSAVAAKLPNIIHVDNTTSACSTFIDVQNVLVRPAKLLHLRKQETYNRCLRKRKSRKHPKSTKH